MMFPPLLSRFRDITTHTVVIFLFKIKQQFPAAWMRDSDVIVLQCATVWNTCRHWLKKKEEKKKERYEPVLDLND